MVPGAKEPKKNIEGGLAKKLLRRVRQSKGMYRVSRAFSAAMSKAKQVERKPAAPLAIARPPSFSEVNGEYSQLYRTPQSNQLRENTTAFPRVNDGFDRKEAGTAPSIPQSQPYLTLLSSFLREQANQWKALGTSTGDETLIGGAASLLAIAERSERGSDDPAEAFNSAYDQADDLCLALDSGGVDYGVLSRLMEGASTIRESHEKKLPLPKHLLNSNTPQTEAYQLSPPSTILSESQAVHVNRRSHSTRL
jgi:hypothetical protein